MDCLGIAVAYLSSLWPVICDVYSVRSLNRWSLLSIFELKQNKLNGTHLSILSFKMAEGHFKLLIFIYSSEAYEFNPRTVQLLK